MPIYRKIPIFISTSGVSPDGSDSGGEGVISANGSRLSSTFSPPIIIPNNKKTIFRVSLATTWYVFPNIVEGVNNTLYLNYNSTPFTYELDKGLYSVSLINSRIGDFLENDGIPRDAIYFIADSSTGKITLVVASVNTFVDFTQPANIGNILGFNYITTPTITPPINFEGTTTASINNVSSINVHASFCNGAYIDGRGGSDVVLSIPISPNTAPSDQIVYEPLHRLESEVFQSVIDQYDIYLTDQNNRPLDLQGEIFTLSSEIVIYD